MNKEQKKQVKKFTTGLFLGWVFGIFLAISGIMLIFSQFLTGVLTLVLAAVLLPPANKFIADKFKISISRGLKFIIVIVLLGLIGATASSDSSSPSQTITDTPSANTRITSEEEQQQPETSDNIDKSPAPVKTKDKPAPTTESAPTQAKQVDDKKNAPTSSETISQKNAVAKAKSYLRVSAFSRDGLVEQLKYGQFSHADAVYGADNSGANWNEQAAKKAKSYMEISAFSRGSLIDQLKHGKFTQAQAEYGANAVGL